MLKHPSHSSLSSLSSLSNLANHSNLLLSILTIFSLTACNQSAQLTKSVAAENAEISNQATVEQAVWLKLTNEAKAAQAAGDKTTAEAKFKEAIEAAKSLAAESPDQAAAIANLADFYYVQGDGAQANHLYTQSLSMREKAVGLMPDDLVIDLVGLAHVYTDEQRYAKAKESLERAVDILKKSGKSIPVDIEVDLKKLEMLITAK